MSDGSATSSGEGASTPGAADAERVVLIVVVLRRRAEGLVPRIVVVVLRRGPIPVSRPRTFRWRSHGQQSQLLDTDAFSSSFYKSEEPLLWLETQPPPSEMKMLSGRGLDLFPFRLPLPRTFEPALRLPGQTISFLREIGIVLSRQNP